jgi:hypothetical protein
MASATLTVTDPRYRSRILAVHVDLSTRDAAELAAIYRALGYPRTCIKVAPASLERAA